MQLNATIPQDILSISLDGLTTLSQMAPLAAKSLANLEKAQRDRTCFCIAGIIVEIAMLIFGVFGVTWWGIGLFLATQYALADVYRVLSKQITLTQNLITHAERQIATVFSKFAQLIKTAAQEKQVFIIENAGANSEKRKTISDAWDQQSEHQETATFIRLMLEEKTPPRLAREAWEQMISACRSYALSTSD